MKISKSDSRELSFQVRLLLRRCGKREIRSSLVCLAREAVRVEEVADEIATKVKETGRPALSNAAVTLKDGGKAKL